MKRLLFICVENSNRSQMAEALARMKGGAEVEAHSAGSAPSGRVNPKAIASMAELGYDLSTHRSESPDELPAAQFDVLVSMGCGDRCPSVPASAQETWAIPDPKALPPEEFRLVREAIAAKVDDLLWRLGVEPAPSSPTAPVADGEGQ